MKKDDKRTGKERVSSGRRVGLSLRECARVFLLEDQTVRYKASGSALWLFDGRRCSLAVVSDVMFLCACVAKTYTCACTRDPTFFQFFLLVQKQERGAERIYQPALFSHPFGRPQYERTHTRGHPVLLSFFWKGYLLSSRGSMVFPMAVGVCVCPCGWNAPFSCVSKRAETTQKEEEGARVKNRKA
jgi:hypothetical protein